MNEWMKPQKKANLFQKQTQEVFPQTWTHQASQRMGGLAELSLGRFLEWCPITAKASGAWGCKRAGQDVASGSSCSYQRNYSQDSGTTEKEEKWSQGENVPVPLLPPEVILIWWPWEEVEKDQDRILRHSPFPGADFRLLHITALTW